MRHERRGNRRLLLLQEFVRVTLDRERGRGARGEREGGFTHYAAFSQGSWEVMRASRSRIQSHSPFAEELLHLFQGLADARLTWVYSSSLLSHPQAKFCPFVSFLSLHSSNICSSPSFPSISPHAYVFLRHKLSAPTQPLQAKQSLSCLHSAPLTRIGFFYGRQLQSQSRGDEANERSPVICGHHVWLPLGLKGLIRLQLVILESDSRTSLGIIAAAERRVIRETHEGEDETLPGCWSKLLSPGERRGANLMKTQRREAPVP